jgi:hypothetical protein
MICIARIFGAPLTVIAGKRRAHPVVHGKAFWWSLIPSSGNDLSPHRFWFVGREP